MSYFQLYSQIQPGDGVKFKDGAQLSAGVVISREGDMFLVRRTDDTTVKIGYGLIRGHRDRSQDKAWDSAK